MTVGELIAELQKLPAHHLVILETYTTDMTCGAVSENLDFIADLAAVSNVGDLGCAVKIMAEVPTP
jgi:hypothetical protein